MISKPKSHLSEVAQARSGLEMPPKISPALIQSFKAYLTNFQGKVALIIAQRQDVLLAIAQVVRGTFKALLGST